MNTKTDSLRAGLIAGFLLSAVLPMHAAGDVSTMPMNLGGGLRELAAEAAAAPNPQQRAAAVRARVQANGRWVQSDPEGRVVVDVHLNGATALADVRIKLEGLGARVLAAEPAGRSTAEVHGVISAFLPVEQAAAVAKLPGVQSVTLVHRPKRRAGARTSQGLVPTKVHAVHQRGFRGLGITVGVISDSYNTTQPSAGVDIQTGDLPGARNPAGRTTPVKVVQETPEFDPYATDEGRALLQILHDVAPDSALAFCTSGNTQATFAAAVRRLRTEGDCDVIVDDIGYFDEPFFSDGVASKAVDEVVNSTTLAGRKALYYSAAGNSGELGYEADFSPISNASARGGMAGTNNLQLSTVPAALTGGGFHNFTPGEAVNIAQKIVVGLGYLELAFQWNDLFDAEKMTSDYNLLIFDEDGRFISDIGGGRDDNFATGQALEFVDLFPNRDGSEHTYQLAIARTSAGAGTARHFRYLADVGGTVSGTFFKVGVPTTFGHAGARSSSAVAAYQYNKLKRPEAFTSFGPVTIYFDDAGNRRTTPEVRQQPSFAGPDGVATTVSGFESFYGTSAAAPHVAGVAALLLQAHGGRGSLTTAQVRDALQSTAFPHELDPLTSTAESITERGTVTLTGTGDESNFASANNRFFTLHFAGPAGAQLQRVAIDLTAAALVFDADEDFGLPFTIGHLAGGATAPETTVLVKDRRKLVLTFTNFPVGGTLQFGIDRDFASTNAGANSGDLLAGTRVNSSIVLADSEEAISQPATFINQFGNGYSPADGFGLINANAAAQSLGH